MALRVTPLLLLLLLPVALLQNEDDEKKERRKWFRVQHYNSRTSGGKDEYCKQHMKEVMDEAKRRQQGAGPIPWKERNTIIHGDFNSIQAICTDKGGTKLPGNLHQSLEQFQLTLCILPNQKQIQTSKTHTNPKYRATKDSRIIVIGCDEDNFPVHFDESWKPTTNQ